MAKRNKMPPDPPQRNVGALRSYQQRVQAKKLKSGIPASQTVASHGVTARDLARGSGPIKDARSVEKDVRQHYELSDRHQANADASTRAHIRARRKADRRPIRTQKRGR